MKKHYVYTITYFDRIVYVGKTCNMVKRKSLHKTDRGTFRSAIPVDADLNKVEFNVVAEFDNKEEALKYEDELILQYGTIENGWNKNRSGLVYSDREYVLAYNRDYNADHKEERAAYMRDYYQTHKEEKAAYMRAYRAQKKLEKNSPALS